MMSKRSLNNCNKKSVVNGIKSRSSNLNCETHGIVSSREPCVKLRCSACSKPGILQNKNAKTGRLCHGEERVSKGMGDNEMIDFERKRSSYNPKVNHSVSKNSQKVGGPVEHVSEESVDIIPTKLNRNRQVQNAKYKTSHKNDSDSDSSKQLYPVTKRTTWDCILREQNIDLVRNKQYLKPKSKSSSFHENKQQTSKPISLQDKERPDSNKSSVSDQANKNVHIVKKCESACCSHNTKINTDGVEIMPTIHNDTRFPPASKLSTQQNLNSQASAHCSSTNPVLTLDLLVKELREKLRQQVEDDDLQRIILDMEHALSRFPANTGQQKENCNEVPKPEEFKKTIEKKFDIKDCKSVDQLHIKLEESCQFLQEVYEQLHEAGKKHREEKERLSLNLLECRRLLAISRSRENDMAVTIKELRLILQDKNGKGDQHVQAIHELTQIISRLQEENKCIAPLKASQAKLIAKYHEIVPEKEKLHSQLELLNTEKEKLTMLMQVKDKEMEKMKQNFEDIKAMFGNHLLDLEVVKEPQNFNLDSTLSSVLDKESDEQFRPICSSLTSSIPGSSPSPYSSWQVISSIVPKPKATVELKKGIRDLFMEMKKETEELNPNKLLPMPANYGSGISDSNDDDGPQFKSIPQLKIPSDILESDLSS